MTVHVREVDRHVLLSRSDLNLLVELARRSEPVAVEAAPDGDDLPARQIAHLADTGSSFDFLNDEPDEYSVSDLKVRYR